MTELLRNKTDTDYSALLAEAVLQFKNSKNLRSKLKRIGADALIRFLLYL